MWKWRQKQLRPPVPDGSRVLKAYPELGLFKNRDDREEAYKAALRRTSGWTILAIFNIPAQLVLFFLLGNWDALRFFWARIGDAAMLGMLALSTVLASFLISQFRQQQIICALRQALGRQGHPICLHCGYDLQGQSIPRCPECGVAFDPRLLKPQENASPRSRPDCETEGERG